MQAANQNVDIKQTTAVTCDECGGVYFEQALTIRKASGLLTGTGNPAYVPIPVFACKECSHVNGEFIPKEVQSLDWFIQRTAWLQYGGWRVKSSSLESRKKGRSSSGDKGSFGIPFFMPIYIWKFLPKVRQFYMSN